MMELLLLLNSLCWEEKERKKRKVTALPKETNTDILPLNSTLSATTQLTKTALFKESRNCVSKKAVKPKESLWLLIGIDTTVASVA